jgi:hypothetical protein
MHPGWSALVARVSNRLARHFCVAPLELSDTGPIVSFTLDDVPKSAATVVAPILAEYNITELARAICLPQSGRSRASGRPHFRFILLPMRIRCGGIAPPAMQPAYCRDIAKFVECACAIGRAPIRYGRKYSSRLVDLTDTRLLLCGP